MLGFLERYEAQTYALLRIVTGLLFLWHGSQKLFGFPAAAREGTPEWITYGAGSIELVGGVLVMIGLFTRPAALICSGTMAVAYWLVHGMRDLFPLNNGGELAALYCFVFLFIACRGAGIWGVDRN
ncbi:MAG: DoxX family protein [Gammaproteobacteria bacterium]|nr:DoxX family protein [Gammaproteobacteria bacterium]